MSLIASLPLNSALAKTASNNEGQLPSNEKGKVILKYTAPETSWESATPEEKETLKEIGWELEDGVLVQYRDVSDEIEVAIEEGYLLPKDEEKSYDQFLEDEGLEDPEYNEGHKSHEGHEGHNEETDTLLINGQETEINEGRFTVEGDPSEIEVQSNEESDTKVVQKDENGEYKVIIEQNLNEILGHMEEHSSDGVSTFGYGDTYKEGDWVHCNRFNGPRSNNKHLQKWKPQAIINFYHSDCDYGALRYCKSHKNCNQKYRAAYCSYKQGHSTLYHKH